MMTLHPSLVDLMMPGDAFGENVKHKVQQTVQAGKKIFFDLTRG